MANPRQRRKSRSSSYKPVSHSRHAKRNLKKTPPIRGPKILQESWDNTKTVRQNYAALGLIHTLNPLASGGSEPQEERSLHGTEIALTQALPQPSAGPSRIPQGFGKIIRDDLGNVVRVEMAEEVDDGIDIKMGEDMDTMASQVEAHVMDKWVTALGGNKTANRSSTDVGVVKALEGISTVLNQDSTTLSIPLSNVGARHSSAGEVAYLGRLISKYGDDVEQMAKDRRLNPDQHTAGALRRALKKAGLEDKRS